MEPVGLLDRRRDQIANHVAGHAVAHVADIKVAAVGVADQRRAREAPSLRNFGELQPARGGEAVNLRLVVFELQDPKHVRAAGGERPDAVGVDVVLDIAVIGREPRLPITARIAPGAATPMVCAAFGFRSGLPM